MKTLYDILIELSTIHSRFKGKTTGFCDLLKFDLNNKTIRNGKTVIMRNGRLIKRKICLKNGMEYDLKDIKLINIDENIDIYKQIEMLYKQYKYSVPSETANFSRCNFKALSSDEMTTEQLLNGIPRVQAQYMLEAFILLASVRGKIEWKNPKYFYWQSPNDKDLILFREWI